MPRSVRKRDYSYKLHGAHVGSQMARLVTGDRESREPCGDQHQGHQDITAGCHFHTQLSPVNTLASLPGQMTE